MEKRIDPPWAIGYDAWLLRVRSQVRVFAGTALGLAWSLYKCAALWSAVYYPSATEESIGTICEEKGIFSWFGVYILSRYDLSC